MTKLETTPRTFNYPTGVRSKSVTAPTKPQTVTSVDVAQQWKKKASNTVARKSLVESMKSTTTTKTEPKPIQNPQKTKRNAVQSNIPMKRYGQFKKSDYTPLRALGVDQGYANCGFSVVEWSPYYPEPKVLAMGVIETKANLSIGERLSYIEGQLTDLAKTYEVSAIGCEKLFVNPPQKNAGTQENPFAERNKSASIVTTSMVSGIIHMIAYRCGLFVQDYTPGTVKKQVTGNGRASKDRVYQMVESLIPIEFLYKKQSKKDQAAGLEPKLRKPKDHETDAVAIGITTIKEYFLSLENETSTVS